MILALIVSTSILGACRKQTGTGHITSRYAEQEGVSIDPAKVPEDLRDLIPLAEKWAIADDDERTAFLRSAGKDEKKELIDKVWPRMQRIEQFNSRLRDEVPAPDEVVLFDMLMDAAEEAYPEVYPKK